MEMEGSTMSAEVAMVQGDQAAREKTSTSNAGDHERTLIEKIGRHKQKIFVLFEQMQKLQLKEGGPASALPTGLYEQLIEELELVAPLFDLLEHKGLSIYITSLADSYGTRFPHMLTKICKRFGVKRPPSLPRLPPTDDSQLSAKKLERKRAKERLAALFSPPPMPTTPYLDEKEKREKEQEERAKELAKTPLSALLAKEQQSKQHRRRSTIGTMRFSEGLGHLHRQVLLTSPARRAPTTPTRSVAVINRSSVPASAATTTTPTTTPSANAELTPSRKRKESADDDGELLRRSSFSSAPHTPEPATATAPTEPSSEPPQKRRRTGFAITRTNPTLAPASPAASSSAPTLAQEPQTEPRLRTSGFAITRTAPMSPLAAAASPRPRRFGAITRTPAKAGAAALPRLTVRATRQLFAGPDSSSSSTSSSSSGTFAASSTSLFDAIVVPPPGASASSSSFMTEC